MADHVFPFNVSSAVADLFLQMLVQGFYDMGLAFFIQTAGLFLDIEILVFCLFAGKKIDSHLICEDSEWFNEIKHQGFFIIVICVHEPYKRIKAGMMQAFSTREKHTVAIIQHGSIERIQGRPRLRVLLNRYFSGMSLEMQEKLGTAGSAFKPHDQGSGFLKIGQFQIQ